MFLVPNPLVRIGMAALGLFGAAQVHAQPAPGPGVSYEPPPVEYAGPDNPAGPVQAAVAPPVAGQSGGPRLPRPRIEIRPYAEVLGGVSAELAGGNGLIGDEEVLTYTSVAAGVDGQVATRRVVGTFGYRYERRFELSGDLPDQDVHSGIAQVRAEIVPSRVSVEAGGIATRTGGRGAALGVTERDDSAEIYSVYAGPTLSTRAGPVAVNAFYRLGYVHVDDDTLAGAGTPDGEFDATVHLAGGSVGEGPGRLPVGWTVSVGHVTQYAGLFESAFHSSFVRGDVLLPVNPALALTAGVGYSWTKASQRDVLRGPGGVPLFDGNGNLFPDPDAPRVTTYDQSGIFADAGFIWRPTPRSELQLRAGINDDGDPIVAGSAAFRFGRMFGLSFTLYDNDESYGSALLRNLDDLPGDFEIARDPLTGGLAAGCVFSRDEPGRGVCLSPALQAITAASFRARGGSILLSGDGRIWSFGGGISYARRDYYLPDDPIFADVFAPGDQDLALFASVGRRLGRFADIGFDGFLSFYDSEAPDSDVTTLGGRGSFTRAFLLDRLQLLLALGLTYRSFLAEDSLVADGLVGLRYTF